MTVRSVLALCVVGSAVVGWGWGDAARVRVAIDVATTVYRDGEADVQHRILVLTCHPTGGTLPFAARVCRDIEAHPVAMLAPGRTRATCSGIVPLNGRVSTVALTMTTGGVTTRSGFGLQPGCHWPGGARVGVYLAAAERDGARLVRDERQLRCEEGAFRGAHPPDVGFCLNDSIRRGEQHPALAALNPEELFPQDTGSRACTIETGGAVTRKLPGRCSVARRASGTLVFVQRWTHDGLRWRHSWWFNAQADTLLVDFGAVPPQLWR